MTKRYSVRDNDSILFESDNLEKCREFQSKYIQKMQLTFTAHFEFLEYIRTIFIWDEYETDIC